MPEREYFIPLGRSLEGGDRIRVWIRTERGQLVDFVAQYQSLVATGSILSYAMMEVTGEGIEILWIGRAR